MNRTRDRASAQGLLPRMEARPRKDGLVTYRYHPMGGKPINLGTDKQQAIRRVLDLLGDGNDAGTVRRLWQQYQDAPDWKRLGDRTRADYKVYSEPLLRVFGDMRAAHITAPMVARYLRVERAEAPVRANREKSLLSNLMQLAIERGEATANPCREVRRNREAPRTVAPSSADIQAMVDHAKAKGGQWVVVTMAAEFAALAGSRKAEFLGAHWSQVGEAEIRLIRAKQREGVERVDRVQISPALRELLERLRGVARNDQLGVLFPNRQGNAYTPSGFAAMWGKLMREVLAQGVVQKRFTFHDLRAHYATEHKRLTGHLPDLHADPGTTARVYERSREAKRRAL
jgi:integrase